jgi:hypothetical protein
MANVVVKDTADLLHVLLELPAHMQMHGTLSACNPSGSRQIQRLAKFAKFLDLIRKMYFIHTYVYRSKFNYICDQITPPRLFVAEALYVFVKEAKAGIRKYHSAPEFN